MTLDPTTLLQLAVTAAGQDDFATALTNVYASIEAGSTDTKAIELFLNSLQKQAETILLNPKLSEKYISKLLTLDNVAAELLDELANTLLGEKAFNLAAQLLERVFVIEPGYLAALDKLGYIYNDELGETDKSLVTFDKYIGLLEAESPVNKLHLSDAYNSLGVVYFNNKVNYDEAIKIFIKGVGVLPQYKLYNNIGLAYFYKEDYENATQYFGEARKIAITPSQKADVEFNLGLIQDKKGLYTEALVFYSIAVKYDRHAYAQYNTSLIFDLFGDFKQSFSSWNITLEFFKSDYTDKAKFESDPENFFFYAEALFNFKHVKEQKDFDLIEELLKQYVVKGDDKVNGYTALVRCYRENRSDIEDGVLYPGLYSAERMDKLNELQYKLIVAFNTGLEIAKSAIAQTNAIPYNARGDLYREFGYFDEAQSDYQAALKIDSNADGVEAGIGICLFRTEKYKEAIEHFKKALLLQPDELTLQCNLADAFRSAGDLPQAERLYERILAMSPHYLDGIIGLGECYKSMGDQFYENGDNREAEEYYCKAKDNFAIVFDCHGQDYASKLLRPTEQGSLRYSQGYAKVMLSETAGWINKLRVLLGAKQSFNAITKSSTEYFKAQKNIKLINKKLFAVGAFDKRATNFLLFLSFILLILYQVAAISNYLDKEKVYGINWENLKAFVRRNYPDSAAKVILHKMPDLNTLTFPNQEKAERKLDTLLPSANILNMESDPIVDFKMVQVKSKQDMLAYISTTFALVMLVIISICLPLVTRLKLGSIEMDKNTVDTVKASTFVQPATKPS